MGRARNDGRGRHRKDRPLGHTERTFHAITSIGRYLYTSAKLPPEDASILRIEQVDREVIWSRDHS